MPDDEPAAPKLCRSARTGNTFLDTAEFVCASLSICVLALWPHCWAAPAPNKNASFEVASVKPASPPESELRLDKRLVEVANFQGGPGTNSPNRITYRGVTLRMLLARAYQLKDNQINGPAWLDDRYYEVLAIVPPDTDVKTFGLMLQNLLTDRFKIKSHRETKPLPVYALRIARNGPKLHPAQQQKEYADDSDRRADSELRARALMDALRDRIKAGDLRSQRVIGLQNATVGRFAEVLSPYVDHPVLDLTGLKGTYSFRLEWVVDNSRQPGADIDNSPAGPSLTVALEEQLGLRLRLEKHEVDELIIDQATRIPASN